MTKEIAPARLYAIIDDNGLNVEPQEIANISKDLLIYRYGWDKIQKEIEELRAFKAAVIDLVKRTAEGMK